MRAAAEKDAPDYNRSISKPPEEPGHELWIRKARSGPLANSVSLADIEREMEKRGKRQLVLAK